MLRILLICFGVFLTACSGGSDAPSKLVITGSSTIAPVAQELASAFEKTHPGSRIDVQTGGSSRGINDTRQGLADIGMVSRALKSTENDLQSYLLAKDGVSLIVHSDNPLRNITRQQVIDIYTGKITKWSQLGIDLGDITVIHKADGRSTQEVFLSRLELRPSQIQASAIIGDNEQGIKLVSGNPNAIAYVSIGTAEYSAKAGQHIRLLKFEGVEASTQTVESGHFPISRELNFITLGPPNPLAQQFLDFTRTTTASNIIRSQSFVPIPR